MIKKLTVRNYKSLKETTISFQPLTVLAGPNASGKTNILDALSFVCDLVQRKNPLESRGKDFRLLAWGGLSQRIDISLAGSIVTVGNGEQDFEYCLELSGQEGRLIVDKESIRCSGEILLDRDTPLQATLVQGGAPSGPPIGTFPDAVAISLISTDHKELAAIRSFLSNCVFYDFIPWQMKQWQKVKREDRLEAAGENIATLLHSIQRAESPLYQDVLERLKAAIPRVEAIETDLTEEDPARTYVQLREQGLPQPIKSFSISEGTFRMLGILLALFSPNPARLVTIEGPETNVHPHLFKYIASYLKTASKSRQVIVTTHSPHFIKHFQPNNLVIVEMKKGCTRCRPVAGKRGLREALKVLDLGELYYSGELGGMP